MKKQPKSNVVKAVPFGGKAAPKFSKTNQPKKAKAVIAKGVAKKKAPAKRFNATKYEAARKKVFSLPNTKEY